MAITNAMIILQESVRLMEAGIIRGSGEYAIIDGGDGPRRIELPEALHTFERWKALGYSVKKGEHARAAFDIWKYVSRKSKPQDGDEADAGPAGGHCIMKKAFFFTRDQVEALPVRA